jgi:hypothetical protein
VGGLGGVTVLVVGFVAYFFLQAVTGFCPGY